MQLILKYFKNYKYVYKFEREENDEAITVKC